MQREHREWVDKNFPGETLERATLGVCEESGELAHAVLKMQQGIRGTEAEHKFNAIDSVADMIIFGLSVCDHLEVDLEDVLAITWDKVKKRDWKKDPVAGGEDIPLGGVDGHMER
jgi:NTP pyrophosphatase (non-canonical NTP hydrolase)